MRKEKIYHVDTINYKAMSINDNVNFYSRDTDAFLVFNLNNSAFEFDSATLFLVNLDEGSTIIDIETVKTNNGAEYELEPRVLSRYGRWRGQIIFKKNNESAATAIFEFIVNRFLTDERPPTLNEVESIAKLRRDAKELIEVLEGMTYDNDSLVDVLQAKDGELTLDARIRRDVKNLENKKADKAEVSARLADKANRTEIQAVNLAYKESFATLVALQTAYPTGDIYNHVVTADGMIYTYTTEWVSTNIQANGTNVPNKSIVPFKTSYLKPKNLFNTAILTGGKYYSYVNGSPGANASYSTMNYIAPVTTGAEILISDFVQAGIHVCFYNSGNVFVSGVLVNTPGYVIVPAGCVGIRISLATSDVNTVVLAEQYKAESRIKIGEESLEDLAITTPKIVDKAITKAKVDFLTEVNAYDPLKSTDNYFKNFSTGGIVPNATYCYSDYIPLDDSKIAKTKGSTADTHVCYYDENQFFISGQVVPAIGGTLTIPVGTKFVVVSIPKADKNTFSLSFDYLLNDVVVEIPESKIVNKLKNTTILEEQMNFASLPSWWTNTGFVLGKNLSGSTGSKMESSKTYGIDNRVMRLEFTPQANTVVEVGSNPQQVQYEYIGTSIRVDSTDNTIKLMSYRTHDKAVQTVIKSLNLGFAISGKNCFIEIEKNGRTLTVRVGVIDGVGYYEYEYKNSVVSASGVPSNYYTIGTLQGKPYFEVKSGSATISYFLHYAKCKKDCLIYVIGDSITEGYGVEDNLKWGRKLQDIFGMEEVCLSGIGGAKPDEGLERMTNELANITPKNVIYYLGTNGLTATPMLDAFALAKSKNARTFQCSISSLEFSTYSNYMNMGDFLIRIDAVTRANSAIITNLFQADGVHPNVLGCDAIYNKMVRDASSKLKW